MSERVVVENVIGLLKRFNPIDIEIDESVLLWDLILLLLFIILSSAHEFWKKSNVENTDIAEKKGYDAGKKISGIKRHIAIDTQTGNSCNNCRSNWP